MNDPSIDGRPDGRMPRAAIDAVLVLIPLLIFAAFVFPNLRAPGFFGDEAWAAVPAMKLVHGERVVEPRPWGQVVIFGRAVPWMIHDYVGPVQPLYLAVAFRALGISVETVRIATATAGLMTILFTFLIGRRFGRLAGFIAALFLATDLGFQILSRHDYGTAITGLLLQTMAIYLLLRWIDRQRRWPLLAAAMFLLGLAFTYKSNLLALAVAAPLAVAIVYGRLIERRLRAALIALVSLLAGAWPTLVFNLLTGGAAVRESGTLAWSDPLIPRTAAETLARVVGFPGEMLDRATRIGHLLHGERLGESIVGEPFAADALFGGSLLPLGVVAGSALLLLLLRKEFGALRRPILFLLFLAVASLLFFAAAPMARTAYHMLLIYPFPHLLAATGLALLWHAYGEGRTRMIGRAASLTIILLVTVSNVSQGWAYRTSLAGSGGTGDFSPAIYTLNDVLEESYHDRVVQLLDWGMWHPLMILRKGDFFGEQQFWRLDREREDDAWLKELLRDPANVWVARGSFRLIPRAEERFRRVVKEMGFPSWREIEVRDSTGERMFAVIDLHHQEWERLQSGERFAELAPRNLLENPSFEHRDERGLPAVWAVDPSVKLAADEGQAHSGSMAIRSGTGGAWQSVPVEPGGTYVLGHYTRSDSRGAWGRLQVNFLGENGEPVDVAIRLVPASREWRWHEMAMTVPEKATIAAIYAHTHQHAEVWFDDLCFAPDSD